MWAVGYSRNRLVAVIPPSVWARADDVHRVDDPPLGHRGDSSPSNSFIRAERVPHRDTLEGAESIARLHEAGLTFF
jgi:hypothetical protein